MQQRCRRRDPVGTNTRWIPTPILLHQTDGARPRCERCLQEAPTGQLKAGSDEPALIPVSHLQTLWSIKEGPFAQ